MNTNHLVGLALVVAEQRLALNQAETANASLQEANASLQEQLVAAQARIAEAEEPSEPAGTP